MHYDKTHIKPHVKGTSSCLFRQAAQWSNERNKDQHHYCSYYSDRGGICEKKQNMTEIKTDTSVMDDNDVRSQSN